MPVNTQIYDVTELTYICYKYVSCPPPSVIPYSNPSHTHTSEQGVRYVRRWWKSMHGRMDTKWRWKIVQIMSTMNSTRQFYFPFSVFIHIYDKIIFCYAFLLLLLFYESNRVCMLCAENRLRSRTMDVRWSNIHLKDSRQISSLTAHKWLFWCIYFPSFNAKREYSRK